MKKIIRYIKNHKIITTICIILIFCLSLSLKIYKFNIKYKTSENTNRMQVIIENLEVIKEDKISYLVKYNGDKFILNIYRNKYSKENIDLKKLSQFKYGDVISFRGKIIIPQKLGNPYEFDYKKYLNSKNVVGTITTYDVKLVDVKFNNVLIKLVYDLKDKVSNRIDKIMPQKESNLFKSMLYGDDKFLEEDIEDNFNKSGLNHLLAVSGSNITTFFIIISYICKKLNKTISIVLTFILSFIFCVFCSFELSIVRASIFLIISNFFQKEERKLNIYLKIFFSFIILILYNPYCIFNIGMIMSYVSVISMVMFQSQIFSLFDIGLKMILKIKYIKPKGFKKYIYEFFYLIFFPLSITISVQILLFPIQIYFFNSFYLITFLSNIIISYIDNVFGIIGFSTIILSFVPFVSENLANTSFIILRCIIFLSDFFSKFEVLKLKLATPDIFSILIYYICIVILNFKKYIILYIKVRSKKKVNIVIKIIYIISILYIIFSYIYLNFFESYVIYFNVEQGNMALIHYKNKNILVDIGSTTENLTTNIIINFLKRKNIEKIDAVILTHFHTDHINGLNQNLLNSIEIERVIYSMPQTKDKEYQNVITLLNSNNISKIEVTKNDKIKIGQIEINIISPDVNKKINDKDIANANSIVTLIKVKDKTLMFMGDATKETEKAILKNNLLKNIDVYQVGHHGSKTSTSEVFLSKFNINIAVISSKKKIYNHPAKETLNTLLKHNIKVKITEKNGAFKYNI